MNSRLLARLFCTIALLSPVPSALAQGSLTPPPGPPVATMKSLAEISTQIAGVETRFAINLDNTPGDNEALFVIAQSGSYYLAGNITGESGKAGIRIMASDVTLDLNGFALQGVSGSLGGVLIGNVGFSAHNVRVRNGTVRSWGGVGVGSSGWSPVNGTFEDLLVESNGHAGLYLGTNSMVARCVSNSNGSHGIYLGRGSAAVECSTNANGGYGVFVSAGGAVRQCIARENASSGIFLTAQAVAEACVAEDNDGAGISVGYQQGAPRSIVISECVANGNRTNGINGGAGAIIENCTVAYNREDGIMIGSYCIVRGNNCTSNGDFSSGNSYSGIYSYGARNRIEDNLCNEQFGPESSGIRVYNFSNHISGNTCVNNDIGIRVAGSRHNIEGNHLTDNDLHGLLVVDSGNLITRNVARNVGGTNYKVAAGNRGGAYVAPAQGAAIDGATGGAGSGTTDPFANLSF